MATQVKIDSFDPSKISLELWLSLLEAHFAHLGVTEDAKKRNGLLVSVGTETYSVLGNLCAPDLPHTKGYNELVEALKKHYDVKPSYHRSLMTFQLRKKRPQDSLNGLYADLKALAKDCSFGDQFDKRVRDQLFMAVEEEVYFPNLVAENLDLQKMTSNQIFERILNLEKAFVSDKTEPQMKAVKVKAKKTDPCRHCGFPHESALCKFKDLTCHRCKKRGHLQRVCSTVRTQSSENKGTQKRKVVKAVQDTDTHEQSVSEEDEHQLLAIRDFVCSLNIAKYNFTLDGEEVPLEIDTGAAVSTLTSHWAQRLQLPVASSSKRLSAYDNSAIEVKGTTSALVKFNGCETVHTFYVVGSQNANLCGRDLMNKVGIYLSGLDQESKVNEVTEGGKLLDQYCVDPKKPISSLVAKIQLKSDAQPRFMKARSVPYFYKEMVSTALDKLVKEGVLEPLSCSEWAAPIVPVLKADQKSVRICGDFKELNKHVHCDRYPLPRIEELLSGLGKGKIFSKIDLQNAYLQLAVEDKSQEYLVINTPKGLFKYKRLPFGLSSSPGIFQRFMSQLFDKMEGVAAYLDDIIVCGSSKEEHNERLIKVLQILQDHNVKINKNKSVLYAESLEYLGYHISGKGIKPSNKKLEAIVKAPTPTSVAEVHSFVGMITYYCRFIKNFSSKLAPLYNLLKKGTKFKWTEVEEKVFQDIKNDLYHSDLLTNFDGEAKLSVEVDASPYGVGCVLLQNLGGEERPVCFASKTLTAAERRYSQIDREGLALVFALKRFRYYLLGRPFVARTDHKPLLGLFGKEKPIPCTANARIQRWALLLSQYDFDLVYKSGKENVVADALSRLPIKDVIESGIPAEYVKLVAALDFGDISFSSIQKYTQKDITLKQLVNCLKYGWSNEVDALVKEYAPVRADLSLHNDVVLYRNRVVVPSEMRERILKHLHLGHNGIVAMKAEARKWIWWPKMDQDIEEVSRSCDLCYKNFKPSASPVLSWPSAGSPWARVHIDYAGPIDNKYFLVIVDSFTKFLDVQMSSSMTSNTTIELLRKSFCNFGLPEVIVSDNAPYFVSQEMQQFLDSNGVRHVTPAPYNPSSNGLAERAVRTLKEGLKKFNQGTWNTRVCRFLYNYRKTVHSVTNMTPAEMMFSRNFRVPLEKVTKEMAGQSSRNLDKEVFENPDSLYQVGAAVFVRNYGKGEPWVPGEIVDRLGLRNYKVCVQDGGNILWRRHADQLMPRFTLTPNQRGTEKVPAHQNSSRSVREGTDTQVGVMPLVGNGGLATREGELVRAEDRNEQFINGAPISREVSDPSPGLRHSEEVSAEQSNNAASTPLKVSDPPPGPRRSQRLIKAPDRMNL